MSLPLHISTTMGSELTLMAAHARPTSAKITNITPLMASKRVVRKYPARKQEASRITPPQMVFLRPILEASWPMGI